MHYVIELVPAGLVHAELLAGMHKVCFAEAWSAESMAATLSMPGAGGLIAVAGGSLRPSAGGDGPAGMILYRAAAGESEILTLAVLPPWRRQGIAATLLDRVERLLAEAGTGELFLEAAADNAPALALYRGRGFLQVGVRKGYYPGADAVTMRKSLSAS